MEELGVRKQGASKAATWVGAKIGIFAIADGKTQKSGYTQFSYFNVMRVDKY